MKLRHVLTPVIVTCTWASQPIVFEPNRGQTAAKVQWLARGPGYRLFLGEDGLYILAGKQAPVRMKLAGGHPWRAIEGLQPTGGVSNYFIGNDPSQWRTDIPHYARLKVAGVYSGIDLVFYSAPRGLE
jgi:hypothetical protein